MLSTAGAGLIVIIYRFKIIFLVSFDVPQMVRKKQSSTPSSTTSDLSDDPDTEEALKGFDFLAGPDEPDGSPVSRSGEDSGEWGETWGGARGGGASTLTF